MIKKNIADFTMFLYKEKGSNMEIVEEILLSLIIKNSLYKDASIESLKTAVSIFQKD